MSLEQRHVEALEELAGIRRGSTRRQAVRIDDLAPLLKIKTRLQAAKAAGATPTDDEFNALLGDVEYINNRLIEVMQLLQKHVVP